MKSTDIQNFGNESAAARRILITIAIGFLCLFILLPLAAVFAEAFRNGAKAYFSSLTTPDTVAALRLTLLAAAASVPCNLIFGVAAAWAITKYQFRGKGVLLALIDLPFAVSPVVAGLVFILVFGRSGWLGDFLDAHNIKVVFAVPGIVLATIFITFPFIARELIPLMQSQGTEQEQAALVLGASVRQTFFKITLPNIKWGLVYGVVLCSARAVGEFGAVSVVSGHIRGQTNTLPLHIEILYNEYNFVGAFAAASMLTLFAFATLAVKGIARWKFGRDTQEIIDQSQGARK